jgi:hypothetical protein
MEVSSQLHAPAALPPAKELPLPIREEQFNFWECFFQSISETFFQSSPKIVEIKHQNLLLFMGAKLGVSCYGKNTG